MNNISVTCKQYISKIDDITDVMIKEKLYFYFGEFIKEHFLNIKMNVPLRIMIYEHYCVHKKSKLFKLPIIISHLNVNYDKEKFVDAVRNLLAEIKQSCRAEKIIKATHLYNKFLNNIVFIHNHEQFSIIVYEKAKELLNDPKLTEESHDDLYKEQVSALVNCLNKYIYVMHMYYPKRVIK